MAQWQDPNDPNAFDYYNEQAGYGQDPNSGGSDVLGGDQNQPGGGPQQTSQEAQAVDQALQGGGGDGSGGNSPVNPDGNINPTYGATEAAPPQGNVARAGGQDPSDLTSGQTSAPPAETPVQGETSDMPNRLPGGGYQNLDWWGARGVPASEIFDVYTGQLKPGWARTANGYERTTTPGPVNPVTPDPISTGGGRRGPAAPPAAPPNQNPGGGFDLSALLAGMGGGGASSFNGFTSSASLTGGADAPYTPQNIPQYQAPDQSEYERAALDSLKNALGQSEWSGDRIAAMKEAQKEQALRMRSDLNKEVSNRFAGAGRSGSGAQEALLRRGDADTMSQILGAYRGVDENAAQGRRSELLSTVGALDQALSGQIGRGTQGYGATLAGAQGMADEQYRGWQSQMQREAAALQRAIAEESAKIDWRGLDQGGMLQLAQLMEQQRQFNEGMGLDWTKLNLGIVK